MKFPGSRVMVMATHSYNSAFAGLNDAHTLVAAGGADEGAVAAPVHAVDCVRVHIRAQRQHGRPSAHIPHQDHVVTTWAMPPVSEAMSLPPRCQVTSPPLFPQAPALSSTFWAVGCQATIPTRLVWPSRVTTGSRRGSVRPPSGISHTCREGASESWALQMLDPVLEPLLAHVPTTTHHDCAILRATGNDIIIVRAPGNIQHGGCVATDQGHILVHTSSLEGTAGPLRKVC